MRLKHSAAENKMQKTNNNGKRIVIAGGGTGGHLFPGIAIAEAFIKRNPENRVIFISTGKPFEISVLKEKNFPLKTITVEGIKGRGIVNQIISVSKIPKGLFESILILKDFRPNLVVGVGSYSSGPVVLGAWLIGIKIVLHEQNILPGITNRILSYLADRIYVSFKDTQANFDSKKVCFTGNPVRNEILCFAMEESEISGFVQGKLFTILVIGGSQGAHSVNIAVMDALKCLKEKDNFFFIHQTGANDEEKVKNAYRKERIAGTVKAFFNDMGQQYSNADLIICRAGATTMAELTTIGKGALLIPYPFAADDHQVLNAKTLSDAGAAEIILQKELSGRSLARKIEYYASNYKAISNMALMAKKLGRPDAAEAIVDDCYRLMKGREGKGKEKRREGKRREGKGREEKGREEKGREEKRRD